MIYVQLFISFFTIGLFSFGGGYAMLPMIEQEVIQKHAWVSTNAFFDIVAISQVTPGPIAINSATFLGYKTAGVFGATVATFGVILPSFFIITGISKMLDKFKESKYVEYAFKGIRPAVIGLIASACVSITKTSVKDIYGVSIMVVSFIMLSKKILNPIYVICIAGVLGAFIY